MASFYSYVKAAEWDANVDPLLLRGREFSLDDLLRDPSYDPNHVQYGARSRLTTVDTAGTINVRNRETGEAFDCYVVRG